MYIRGSEHQRLYKNKKKNSVMYKHALEEHSDAPDKVEFSMKLAGAFTSSLARIINEGIRIKEREPQQLLNSKSEFHGPSVKRRFII